ncbi:ABC transporter permease [Acidaminobacter sp. JC074]|uniref:ABC transporter permease n=1 Tax=Acidaminobacter sp. JC074 TaxID=2530199 RepID=UPI001F0EBBAB|nr:ABC transporter permease [Acidaminobacter sp. JC074]MCH4888591.1 ABC transporter permease [Acidaminobacter sp. JC074]
MAKFIFKRLLMSVVTLFLISFVVFVIIQLPPGDFVDTMVTNMIAEGEQVTEADVLLLKENYGLNRPVYVQYFHWISGILQGDWGTSFHYNQGVLKQISLTLGNTIMLSFFTMLFTYIVSIPIAIYAAKHQYSIGDYIFTFIGFIGMAIPSFLFAILLMYASYKWFGKPIMGFPDVPVTDFESLGLFIKSLSIPIIVIGLGGTCGLIRSIRAQMLDEQEKPYVLATRAKGVSENVITYKYAMRSVLNPIVSGLGPMISKIFTGSTIVAIVLMLPTNGPVLLKALQSQDVMLSGGILLISATLVVLGTLLSDILLVVLDPRIKQMEDEK